MSMEQESWTRAHRESAFARLSGPSEANTVDQTGGAILALLQKAADAAKDDRDQALAMAHELSLQLRAAEDRADKLQAQVEQLENDARRAEQWLAKIHSEISDKFFRQQEARSHRS